MKDFLTYYQNELLFLREKSKSFSKKHPQIASKLDINDGKSTDPHTERLIESFAFVSAKLNQKIDSTEDSMAFYLLSALYPSLIGIFPPCSIVNFYYNGIAEISNVIKIPKNTSLFFNSKQGDSFNFKTLYDISLYPISIYSELVNADKRVGGKDGWCIEIDVETKNVPIEQMGLNEILFYINSEIIEDALMAYEAIFSDRDRPVFFKFNGKLVKINQKDIVPCGFSDDESISPVSKYSNNSFQLFQEMLHFKQKFMFFKLKNIGQYLKLFSEKNIDKFKIVIDINLRNDRLKNVDFDRLISINSVPIVNLFQLTSDPFKLTNEKNKYLLVPDKLKEDTIEIYSILDIHMIDSETKESKTIQPYFSLSVDSDTNILHDVYWTYSREHAAIRGGDGYDTYISFVDKNMNPYLHYDCVVFATTLCINRFESREIPLFSELDIDNIESGGIGAKIIFSPTRPFAFSEEQSGLWSLVSNLAATHISIANENSFFSSISKLIEIFSNGNRLKINELLSDIVKISSQKIVRRFGNEAWRGFIKGIGYDIFVKDDNNSFFCFFFGTILNQYLSANVSINSFVALRLISERTGEILAEWPPTSGRMDLL